MNLLVTVCGRAGSKGIRGKNFKDFLGKPLLYYTFACIQLYRKRNPENCVHVALNTDSKEMVSLIKDRTDLEVFVVPRKEDLAGDTVSKIDVISDTLMEMESVTERTYDRVLDCDITSPLRTVKDLESLIKKSWEEAYDVVFSVTDSRRNPYFNMVKRNPDGSVSLVIPGQYTARQQAPEIFDMNASLYAYRPEFLKSKRMIFEGRCGIVKMMDTAVLDLDHEHDFELMQIIAKYLFEQYKDFGEIREEIDRFMVTGQVRQFGASSIVW